MTSSRELDQNRIGTVVSLNISNGGVPKSRVADAMVSRLGLKNDVHNDMKHHGGPDRAVCIYSLEKIHALQQEGHPIDVGTVGENVTIEGIDWSQVVPGARLRLGDEVVLEVASFTSPCKTIKASFADGKFARISEVLHPGWARVYARVLSEGQIRFGDDVEVISAVS
jgi:MOSC domain-containing protein YiiM